MTNEMEFILYFFQAIGFFVIYTEFDKMTDPWKEGSRGKIQVVGRFFFMMLPTLIILSFYFNPIYL